MRLGTTTSRNLVSSWRFEVPGLWLRHGNMRFHHLYTFLRHCCEETSSYSKLTHSHSRLGQNLRAHIHKRSMQPGRWSWPIKWHDQRFKTHNIERILLQPLQSTSNQSRNVQSLRRRYSWVGVHRYCSLSLFEWIVLLNRLQLVLKTWNPKTLIAILTWGTLFHGSSRERRSNLFLQSSLMLGENWQSLLWALRFGADSH